MPEGRQFRENALTTIVERLFVPDASARRVSVCHFAVMESGDSAHLTVRLLPTAEDAAQTFAREGDQFAVPRTVVETMGSDGSSSGAVLPPGDPPIRSTESIPELGDENRVWRGYGSNHRGVIKLRFDRFVVELNAPTVDDALSLARRAVAMLQIE